MTRPSASCATSRVQCMSSWRRRRSGSSRSVLPVVPIGKWPALLAIERTRHSEKSTAGRAQGPARVQAESMHGDREGASTGTAEKITLPGCAITGVRGIVPSAALRKLRGDRIDGDEVAGWQRHGALRTHLECVAVILRAVLAGGVVVQPQEHASNGE